MAGLVPSTTYYCQSTSGGISSQYTVTTTALPASTPLVSVSFGSPVNPIPNQNAGDIYANCTSNDGVTYVSQDDTTGWIAGPSANGNMTFGKLTSFSPITGANINGLSNFSFSCQAPDQREPKIVGMYCDAGNVYVSYGRLSANQCSSYGGGGIIAQTNGQIFKTTNHGVSFSNFLAPNSPDVNGPVPSPVTTTMFQSTTLFASASFVMYGPDNGTLGYRVDQQDAYTYLVGTETNYNNGNFLYLSRIPRQSMPGLDAAAVQFFVGGPNGNGINFALDGAWENTPAHIVPIFTSTGKVGFPSIQYMPDTGRYVLSEWYQNPVGTTNNSIWTIYEGPTPTGPWTLLTGGTINWTPQGFYNPIPLAPTAILATACGTPMTMLMSGDYSGAAPQYYQLWSVAMTLCTH